MPEKFNMGAAVPGANKDHRDRPKKPFIKPLTLNMLVNWINKQNWDEYTKKELVRKASFYPQSSLRHFADNVNKQVIKISEEKEKKRKEKNERARQESELRSGGSELGSGGGAEAQKESKSDAKEVTLPSSGLL
jgi:hypothetical protein